jgi:hypothetical protein
MFGSLKVIIFYHIELSILFLSAFFFWQYVSVHGTGTVFLNNESTQKICVK